MSALRSFSVAVHVDHIDLIKFDQLIGSDLTKIKIRSISTSGCGSTHAFAAHPAEDFQVKQRFKVFILTGECFFTDASLSYFAAG